MSVTPPTVELAKIDQSIPDTVDRSHENQLTDDRRLEVVAGVAEMLERGERSTSSIQEYVAKHMPMGSCSRPTAIKYRNSAMLLIHHETKPMNRDNIRALEIGRYTSLIERIYKRIASFEENIPDKGHDDYLKWHETWAKLWARLDQFGARLHAITGLNEITINNGDTAKRIVFVRPGEKPTSDRPDSTAPIGPMSSPPPAT